MGYVEAHSGTAREEEQERERGEEEGVAAIGEGEGGIASQSKTACFHNQCGLIWNKEARAEVVSARDPCDGSAIPQAVGLA